MKLNNGLEIPQMGVITWPLRGKPSLGNTSTSVPTLRPSSSSQATGSWNSMAAMRSRPTSGAC